MPIPSPVPLFHFTHLDNLPSIVREGLLADTAVQSGGLLSQEAGDQGIKLSRRLKPVPAGPGGVVGDYVPFYFAPRSPMLYTIWRGNVPTFEGSTHDLVYLCTTIERLHQLGLDPVLSDRNAAKAVAEFSDDPTVWFGHGFVEWDLMTQTMWNSDREHPDRMERRMAECLVHRVVPWNAILAVGAFDAARKSAVDRLLVGAAHVPPVHVRRDWYF